MVGNDEGAGGEETGVCWDGAVFGIEGGCCGRWGCRGGRRGVVRGCGWDRSVWNWC